METVTDVTSIVTSDSLDTESVTFAINAALLPPQILVVILTVGFNVLVILCVYFEKKLRKANNLYVVSLAAADALLGLLVMNGMLVYSVYGLWPLQYAICVIWLVTDCGCCTVSMIHLCLIAHDRYIAMVKPLEYKSSHKVKHIMGHIIATWILGNMVWMPGVLYFMQRNPPEALQCYFIPHPTYVLLQSIFVYFVPIIAMIYFYLRCLYGLRVHFNKISDLAAESALPPGNQPATMPAPAAQDEINDTNSTTVTTNGPPTSPQDLAGQCSASYAGHNIQTKAFNRKQDHIRYIRTLGVIIVTFLVCWIPFCLFWPILAYCQHCIPMPWYQFANWAGYLNSTINPLLYFLFNRDFRLALKNILRRLCCRK